MFLPKGFAFALSLPEIHLTQMTLYLIFFGPHLKFHFLRKDFSIYHILNVCAHTYIQTHIRHTLFSIYHYLTDSKNCIWLCCHLFSPLEGKLHEGKVSCLFCSLPNI